MPIVPPWLRGEYVFSYASVVFVFDKIPTCLCKDLKIWKNF
jgi:hypothetical protein